MIQVFWQCLHRSIRLLEKTPTLLFQLALLLAILGVLILSISPLAQVDLPVRTSDKLSHFLAFFVLSGFAKGAFPKASLWSRWLLLMSYGLLIEYIQSTLPYRFAEKMDFVANTIGILTFELLLISLRYLKRKMSQNSNQ